MSFSKFLRSIPLVFNSKGKFSRAVNVAFEKHLLATNTVTCGLLMFVGDLMQQEIEYQQKLLKERYDWTRLARMTVVGLGFGPLHHYFYSGLNSTWPLADVKSVVKKVMADQLVMSPACILFFFYSAGLLESKTITECGQELKEKFLYVYTVDWCVWPPTQFINFYYLPLKYQVLYINAMTTVYNVFLSYIKHKDAAQKNIH